MKEPDRVHIDKEEMGALIERLESSNLNNTDKTIIASVIHCHFWIQLCLLEAKMSIKRLKGLFGLRTSEKRKNLPEEADSEEISLEEEVGGVDEADSNNKEVGQDLLDLSPFIDTDEEGDDADKALVKGHGRLGHEEYVGATIQEHPHEFLSRGDPCPGQCGGKLYLVKPKFIVCLKGNSLITAQKHILERLRCSLCGQVFTASPANLNYQKYDETVKAQVAIAKFYMGMPNYRLEKWQGMIGVPLKDSTQWDLTKSLAQDIETVYCAMEGLAAQGDIIAHDDTPVRILSCIQENKTRKPGERTGMFTTAIVSKFEGRPICLFYPGRKHSGENMERLMSMRYPDLEPFIRMCDALSSNLRVKFLEILCLCLTHGRRKFYEIYDYFPGECGCVIDALALVYKHDAISKKRKMGPDERLAYHQEKSGPILMALKDWMVKTFEGGQVEPNSSLGKAFKYMLNHWDGLTKFLRIAGCPLDNNLVERTLKVQIMSRKNSLFYKTEPSAAISGKITSLIHTCFENNENPLGYFVAVQKNRGLADQSPKDWLPWNYRETMERLSRERAPPLAA
jgi:transposase